MEFQDGAKLKMITKLCWDVMQQTVLERKDRNKIKQFNENIVPQCRCWHLKSGMVGRFPYDYLTN